MLFVRIRRRCSGGYSSSSQVVVSPIPSLRQEAAAFSLLDSISRVTSSALARADARDSMARIASGAADAHFAVGGRHLGEHVAHEVDHAPLVSGLRQHLADGGDEPGAPVVYFDAPIHCQGFRCVGLVGSGW